MGKQTGTFSGVQKISVVIPVLNSAGTLERCLDSILLQDVEGLEIIVVDGDSIDNTVQILSKYLRRYPHILQVARFINDRGSGHARNVGMDMASGEFIMFVDSDDMLAEGYLEKALWTIREEQADIVRGDVVSVDEQTHVETRWKMPEGIWAGAASLEQLLLRNIGSIAPHAILFRTSMLRRHGLRYPETSHEDSHFNPQAFFFSQKTVSITDVGYYRYNYGSSLTFRENIIRGVRGMMHLIGFLTRFFNMHNLDIESKMYRNSIQMIYSWMRYKLCDVTQRAVTAGELESVLTDEAMEWLASSPEFLRLLLADYAALHCARNHLSPKVRKGAHDWKAVENLPRGPQTYTAYGKADQVSGSRPELSVIMPNYNKTPFLEKSLKSILAQSMLDFELIIIDDASTTETDYEILCDYADTDERIRLYRMDHNSMRGVCCNIGMRLSRGRYLTFVDSDDWVEQDFFADGVALMREEGADCAVFSVDYVDMAGEKSPVATKPFRGGGTTAFYALYEKGCIPWGSWGKFYDADWLHAIGAVFPEYIYHQDSIFLFNVFLKSTLCVTTEKNGYNFLQTPDSSWRPAYYDYSNLYTEWKYCQLIQGVFKDLRRHSYSKLIWGIERDLLPALHAYVTETGALPMTKGSYEACADPHILREICRGFASNLKAAVNPQNILSVWTDHKQSQMLYDSPASPLVSVIIPVYNQEDKIRRCLESVLRQSLRSFEIIIIDDASTDYTSEICLEYTRRDKRVKLIKNERNRGQGYSRNIALEQSRGVYITYVDSDDYILPDLLLKGAILFQNNQAVDVVFFNTVEDINGALHDKYVFPEALLRGKDMFLAEHVENASKLAVWGNIYRKAFLQARNIQFPEHLYEDNIFLYHVYASADQLLFSNIAGYAHAPAVHPASAMQPVKAGKRHLDGALALGCALTEFLAKRPELDSDNFFLESRMAGVFKHFRSVLPLLASSTVDPEDLLTDEHMKNVQGAPYLLRLILEDFASLIGKRLEYSPFLPTADRDPLRNDLDPADYLIPIDLLSNPGLPAPVTLVVAVRDNAVGLAKALDGLLEQDKLNLEILLVEDGSSLDNTLDVCHEYAQCNSNIRLFRTPWKSGLNAARNLALQKVETPFVAFYAVEEWRSIINLRCAVSFLERFPDMDLVFFNEQGLLREISIDNLTGGGRVLGGQDLLMAYIHSGYTKPRVHSALFRTDFLRNNCVAFDSSVFGEIHFWCGICSAAGRVLLAPDSVCIQPPDRTKTRSVSMAVRFFAALRTIRRIQDMLSGVNTGMRQKAMSFLLENHFFRDAVFEYIYATNASARASVLTSEVVGQIAYSKELLRSILIAYASMCAAGPDSVALSGPDISDVLPCGVATPLPLFCARDDVLGVMRKNVNDGNEN